MKPSEGAEVEKKKFSFKFPQRSSSIPNETEVLIYSAYLKNLGIDQDLKLGDWYYLLDEESGQYILALNSKKSVDTTEDFELATSGDFIRLISFEEAMDALKQFGYILAEDAPPIEENADGSFTMNVYGSAIDVSLKVTCGSIHATALKALYLASSVYKTNVECNNELAKLPMFSDDEDEE